MPLTDIELPFGGDSPILSLIIFKALAPTGVHRGPGIPQHGATEPTGRQGLADWGTGGRLGLPLTLGLHRKWQ